MIKAMYAIQEITPNDITILVEDGGIASIHKTEDASERYLTSYYQNNCDYPLMDSEMWDRLNEGKVYLKDWFNKTKIDQDMIDDALMWLCPHADGFEQVEFGFLTNQFFRV